MRVKKKNGELEEVVFDKIKNKIEGLCFALSDSLDPVLVSKTTIGAICDGITTKELDHLSAEVCASLIIEHPDYSILGGRILISRLHKNIMFDFASHSKRLFTNKDKKTGKLVPLVSEEFYNLATKYNNEITEIINYKADYDYDFFSYRTLEKSYFLKNGEILECPQQLLMRVALGIHKNDIKSVLKTYELLSKKYYTHATPTLFNAGTNKPQLASCFLLGAKSDSIDGIFSTIKDCAFISKYGAGIGVHIHNIRSNGSLIAGTNGVSNGIIPMLQVFNHTARYVDQGGGKRKGSFAIYLETWHPEIFEFLELRKNHGKEELRTRDLFTGLWISDLFMKRVKSDEKWSLFCPSECSKLSDTYGDEFEDLYTSYEKEGKASKVVNARALWNFIITSQIETGTPYMLYKDSANKKSNQQNLGTIKSSNLCAEIIEYSDKNETAVCNLASLSLPKFVISGKFDFALLGEVVEDVIFNLNRVIDSTYYPTKESKNSNIKHRPLGLGVQGLADCFSLLGFGFDFPEAKQLNKDIFECMYYHAMRSSVNLSKLEGSYSSFKGSPLSKGEFQFDLWGVSPSNNYDWGSLRKDVIKHGVRNSLLIAPMPTASTSQILGNSECFEPRHSNLFTRRTLSGEFIIVNKYLVFDLLDLNLWDSDMIESLKKNYGSIQNIDRIPQHIRDKYKTAMELKQKVLIDMAIERGPFVCQSQSLNLFASSDNATSNVISAMHFYGWEKGLKTGMYYLRSESVTNAQQFTLSK